MSIMTYDSLKTWTYVFITVGYDRHDVLPNKLSAYDSWQLISAQLFDETDSWYPEDLKVDKNVLDIFKIQNVTHSIIVIVIKEE